MGVSLYVQAVDSDGVGLLGQDTDAALTSLIANGWNADQFGWAVFGLVAGGDGLDLLTSAGFQLGEASLVPVRAHTQLLASVDGVDRKVLEARFDDQAFGEPLGPEPLTEDREWIVDAAIELVQLLQETASSGDRLISAIL